MNYKEITIQATYGNEKRVFNCKPEEITEDKLKKISEQFKIPFENQKFFLNKTIIEKKDYHEPINKWATSSNPNSLGILILEIEKDLAKNMDAENKPKNSAVKVDNPSQVDVHAKIPEKQEIKNQNEAPIKEQVNVNVESEINKDINVSSEKNSGRHLLNKVENEGKNELDVKTENIKIQKGDESESFFRKHKKKFLIGLVISIIIIVVFIVVLLIVLKKTEKTEKNEETEKNEQILENQEIINNEKLCNDRCMQCGNSSIIEGCISCKDGFDLFNGECIKYYFLAKYNITNSKNYMKLFNPDKIDSLYAMKINNKIISPNHELYIYNYDGNNIIYYYLSENSNISLSYLFENIPELLEISFNDENINNNNTNITNIK